MSEQNDILAIHHEAFVREGRMVAMPLGFPGATTPIPAYDSFVTALAIDRTDRYETSYGGTAGKHARLFFGWARGATGIIVDLGGHGDANETGAVAVAKQGIVAALNGPSGAVLMTRHRELMSWDCIQEWFVDIKPFKRAAEIPRRRVTALLPGTRGVAGLADGGPFHWDGKARVTVRDDLALSALTRLGDGPLVGVDASGTVLRLPEGRGASRRMARLDGDFSRVCVTPPAPGRAAWLADASGRLFRIAGGKVRAVGRAPLAPVTCMTESPDGRLFGFCGEGIGNLFVLEPPRGPAQSLGVALSVLNRRRYGYSFSCAVADRDGHFLFGEFERGGHVWLYFPATQGGRHA